MADITKQIVASFDDCHTFGTTIRLTNISIMLSSLVYIHGYMRFLNITIHPGSTIEHAHLEVCSPGNQDGHVDLVVHGIKEANTNTFSTALDADARPVTAASKDWIIAFPFDPYWPTDTWHGWPDGPELKDIIQEQIDQLGWASGNALAIKIGNTTLVAGREIWSYDGAPVKAPTLVVTYTLPSTVASNAAIGINPISAILNGAIENDLGDTYDGRFQWGRTDGYGNDTPWQAGAFVSGDTFSQLIEALEPGTLYHFRAQARDGLGTLSGSDVAFWTLKPSVGRAYAFSRELHIKKPINAVSEASIAASAITTLADSKGINLTETPSSLTLTVEATYAALATQGIKIHVRTSLTDRVVGTHTGADGAAALTDAEAHFVDDELVGLTVKNLTDGSSGAITANTGTGVTATLGGGTNDDWDSGDTYIIEGAGYDTEDWDSFTPAFGAGSSIRQSKHYDVDPVFLKVLVENLDGGEAVTDVKIIMAVGT